MNQAYRVLLFLGVRVDSRSVLGAPVPPLPVDLRGVDAAEEDVAQLLEGHLRRVVEHLLLSPCRAGVKGHAYR